MHKPCKECPFKRNSLPGYLGNTSGDPEEFLTQLEHASPIPCHLTVDWDEDDCQYQAAEAAWNTPCVGAMQFMNNQCKQSRYSHVRSVQTEYGKNPDVFQWKSEFIDHHSQFNG